MFGIWVVTVYSHLPGRIASAACAGATTSNASGNSAAPILVIGDSPPSAFDQHVAPAVNPDPPKGPHDGCAIVFLDNHRTGERLAGNRRAPDDRRLDPAMLGAEIGAPHAFRRTVRGGAEQPFRHARPRRD